MQDVPGEVRQLLRSYVGDVSKLFGEQMQAIILYGSLARGEYLPGRSNVNLLIILEAFDAGVLARYAKAHARWQKEQIVVPLFLTGDELRALQHLFPLEYLEIKDHHVLLTGRDPFPELHPDLALLEVQVQQGIRQNLLRLRQRYVEGGASTEAGMMLLPLSLTALLPCLRGLARIMNRPLVTSSEALLRDLGPALGIEVDVFVEVWSLKRGTITPGPLEAPRLFQRYQQGLETLISRLDRLRGGSS